MKQICASLVPLPHFRHRDWLKDVSESLPGLP